MRNIVNRRALLNTFKDMAVIYGPSKKEKAVATYIKKRLRETYRVREDGAGKAIGGNAGNLIITIPGEGDPLLFAVHMDTVEPCRGVEPVVRDGYITSAGPTILGADDRAAAAVLIELVLGLTRVKKHRPLELVFTVAEEIGLLGANHLDRSNLKGGMAFVFDASEPPGHLVIAAPSAARVKTVFHGKASHAGIEPEKGVSAIRMAAAAINAMPLGRIDHETTANVGVVAGGRASNIIPDRVTIEGETRSHNKEKLAAQRARMHEAMEKAAVEHGGRAEIDWSDDYEGYHLGDDSAPVELFGKAAAAIGLSATFGAGGGGSDANVFNAGGLPAAVVGCGMEKPHSVDERISVEALYKLADLATALALIP